MKEIMTNTTTGLAAVHELSDVMRRAGLGRPDTLEDGARCAITAADAAGLAAHVEANMTTPTEISNKLAAALHANDLKMAPRVWEGLIDLGRVETSTAANLAVLLGTPRKQTVLGYDTSDAAYTAYIEHLGDQLSWAFRRATGSRMLDFQVQSECADCGKPPGMRLGAITPYAAVRLTNALRPQAS